MPATGLKKLIFQLKDSAGSVIIFANRCHWVSLQLCFFLLPFFSVMTIKNTCNFIRLWAQIFAKKVFFYTGFVLCVCDIDSVVELTMVDRLLIEKDYGAWWWRLKTCQREQMHSQGQNSKNRRKKGFSVLVLNVSTPQLYLITSCKTPKEACDMLKFKRDTLANKLFLKKKILVF